MQSIIPNIRNISQQVPHISISSGSGHESGDSPPLMRLVHINTAATDAPALSRANFAARTVAPVV